jgi:hypothetical protein
LHRACDYRAPCVNQTLRFLERTIDHALEGKEPATKTLRDGQYCSAGQNKKLDTVDRLGLSTVEKLPDYPAAELLRADTQELPQPTHRRASDSEKTPGENMKLFKTFAAAFCLLALCLFVVPTAMADDYNKETVVTFSQPIEVPGVNAQILPAGTYVFVIVDSLADRHIVRIFNKEKNHVFTTILAIPNYRLKTTDKTVITFRERPAGQPEAIRAWFYPGREWGEEFVYSKTRALELAKESNEPVLATPLELTTAPEESLKTAPIEAVSPKGEPVELAQVVEPPPPAAVETAPAPKPAVAADEQLPATASNLPLIGLLGLLTIGAGFAVSAFSKRVV